MAFSDIGFFSLPAMVVFKRRFVLAWWLSNIYSVLLVCEQINWGFLHILSSAADILNEKYDGDQLPLAINLHIFEL